MRYQLAVVFLLFAIIGSCDGKKKPKKVVKKVVKKAKPLPMKYVAFLDWHVCMAQDMKVGDTISVRGTLAPGAVRWTCNLELISEKSVFITADHRVIRNETHYNTRLQGKGFPWWDATVKKKVPFRSGNFSMSFIIQSQSQVKITYGPGAAFASAVHKRSPKAPNPKLTGMRKIRCTGDITAMEANAPGEMDCPS
ncbi:unnamed protein product, partial [Mesorhabditis spiculigera]